MASQVQNHTVPAGLPQLWLDCPNLNRQPMLQSIFDKSYSISMADPLRSNEDIFDFPLAEPYFLGYVSRGWWVGDVSQIMYARAWEKTLVLDCISFGEA
ncbi:MAG: hypothetical protein IJS08_13600, partial [Victivallales bacterium]|nr:hypothetical protein [Victivallales bacterium]